jgi:hypothetical protein
MFSLSLRSVLGLVAAGLLGLAPSGCTDIPGSDDVDDVDVEEQVDQASDGLSSAPADVTNADSRASANDGAPSGAAIGVPEQQPKTNGPDFGGMNEDPEPCPWQPPVKDGPDT